MSVPFFGLLQAAAWDREQVEKDVLRIKKWFEYVQPQISKKLEERDEEDRRLDELAAQYMAAAAGLAARAKERDPYGEGSLSHEETIYLQQWEKKLDEYEVVLQNRRLATERSRTAMIDSFKTKIAALQQKVHDKTAEFAIWHKMLGVPDEEIELKTAVSRDAVKEMTAALAKELLPEEEIELNTVVLRDAATTVKEITAALEKEFPSEGVQEVSMLDSLLHQAA